MKKHITYYLTCLLILLSALPLISNAQNSADVVRVEGNMLVVTLDNRNTEECKNLLLYFGLNEDSLFNFGNIGQLKNDGWELLKIDKHVAVIGRSLTADADKIKWGAQPLYFDEQTIAAGTPGYPGPVNYGANKFKSAPTVFENKNDVTVFLLRQNLNATKVFLSGNFNNWSTGSTPMQKTDSGWVAAIKLKPGKYFYKFIVDGNWQDDPNNSIREEDGYGGFNSTYFHHNYTFHLSGNTDAKKVFLTGSFNEWKEKELQMKKVNDGWEINLYLKEGTHAYKFIVDGNWILDPDNKIVRPDGMGHANSYMALGDTTYFYLNGFKEARLVLLTGTFNAWNTAELEMERTETGWKIPYVLAAGNYEYKFIVDGKWITDPDNPFTIGDTDHKNSIRVIKPNYAFTLKGFTNAKEVLLSGNFNNWADPGYKMVKADDGWHFPVYLPAGKYIYKFIVDGKWITDPNNPQTEENQFGTGNSVIWIDPKDEFIEK